MVAITFQVYSLANSCNSHPFDTIKVRLQTTSAYPSALAAASSIYRTEGPLAFYKGTLTPLIGIGACVSVQFGAFHAARRWLETRNTSHGKASDLSYAQYFAAGAFAGVANAPLSGPIEHIRIRLQSQPHGAGRLYSSGRCAVIGSPPIRMKSYPRLPRRLVIVIPAACTTT